MIKDISKILDNIDFSVFPIFPLSLMYFGLKKINKVIFMKDYKLLDEMFQQRLLIENMDYDLLTKCLSILKKEKNRRLKIKINNFLNFRFFKI